MSRSYKHISERINQEEKAINWFIQEKGLDPFRPAKTRYSAIDGLMMSGLTEYLVEIKVRKRFHSDIIKTMGGAYVEFKKVEGIRRFQHKWQKNYLKMPILYFNFFSDCLEIYRLTSDPTKYKWELKMLQKDDYHTKLKEYKFVSFLNESNLIERIYY